MTVIPALRAPIDVVYKQSTDSDYDLNRTAEAALLAGRETIIHRHAYETRKPHSLCAFWVLDWHDEPEYVGLHQLVVIAPPAVG